MKILKKSNLARDNHSRIIALWVSAGQIASTVKPGQFIMVIPQKQGERIPLTVVATDRENILLVFQVTGLSTRQLAVMNPGDSLYALAGPLGNPTIIPRHNTMLLVGGGVGIAELLPIARAMKREGNTVISVIGSRTKSLLIFTEEMKEVSDQCCMVTDDGTAGEKGLVTDVIRRLFAGTPKSSFDICYAVGPLPMMRAVSELTKTSGLHTIVSLNVLMVDATGMCGACRVTVAGKTRFACIDGPEFPAHDIDWEEIMNRNTMYLAKESHICRLNIS